MKRMVVLTVILLAAVSLAAAQDQPVVLNYKFTAGQTDTYATRTTGTLPINMTPGPEAGIPAMGFDTTLDMQMTTQNTCKSVTPDGSGVVEMRIPAMTIRLSIAVAEQPMDIIMKWENGALTSTLNGQQQPLDENGQKLAQALAATLRYTIKPTGEQTPDAETIKLLNALYNASSFTGLDLSRLSALTSRLPAEAVTPGATWQVEDEQTNPHGTIGGKSQLKFTGFEDLDGVRTARIEGQATMSMSGQMPGMSGPMGMNFNITKMETNIAFVNHFDPAKGVMPLSQANLAQNMIMMLTMGGMGGGQAVNLPLTIENAQMTMEMRQQEPGQK
jgi:hypothetical protein